MTRPWWNKLRRARPADADADADAPPAAPPPADAPRRYVDLAEIARGGMGTVREVRDTVLRRVVAMKVLHRALASRPAAVAQFVAEAQITGQLDHPNIAPVHELGVDAQGATYFTMKRVQGRTLAAELAAVDGPPGASARLDDLLRMFLKVCDAVAFAHSRRVVHRDLKPLNVLIGDFGQVYVMDWGLARSLAPRDADADAIARAPAVSVAESAPAPGGAAALVGTLPYMAPEQARGRNDAVDERTDVFALGAMLYQIITGLAPHQGATPMEVLYNAGMCAVVPPEERVPGAALPRALGRIAMRAMAPEPGDRYPSVTALQRDVERFLRGEGRFPTRVFPAGARVVDEGAEGDAAYIILRGRCEAFRVAGGERRVLRTMGPGDVFGEAAVFSSKPRTASVDALDELAVAVVTRDSIAEALGQQPWLVGFVRALADRFREQEERLRDLDPPR